MKIFSALGTFKNRLTTIGNKEPLHLFSLLVIIALDVFVLFNVFQGLYLQKQQLVKPYQVVPYQCQDYIASDPIDPEQKKISNIQEALSTQSYFNDVHNKYASAVAIIENNNFEQVDENCREIFAAAEKVYASTYLQGLKEETKDIEKNISRWESENYRYQRDYDTMLLEDIAGQNQEKSIISGSATTVKDRIAENKKLIDQLESSKKVKQAQMMTSAEGKSFVTLIEEKTEDIEGTLSRLNFWYPLKKIAVEMIFLLPLFVLFLWIYRRNLKKENTLFSFIFSHLLVVSTIPIIIKVFELLIDILPFHFFADFIDLLQALNIVALWNYILIVIGIIMVVGIIYFLQKKVFSAQKIWEKRIQKKKCWHCGKKKFSEGEKFCNFCGIEQTKKCQKCNGDALVKAKFCKDCGDHVTD